VLKRERTEVSGVQTNLRAAQAEIAQQRGALDEERAQIAEQRQLMEQKTAAAQAEILQQRKVLEQQTAAAQAEIGKQRTAMEQHAAAALAEVARLRKAVEEEAAGLARARGEMEAERERLAAVAQAMPRRTIADGAGAPGALREVGMVPPREAAIAASQGTESRAPAGTPARPSAPAEPPLKPTSTPSATPPKSAPDSSGLPLDSVWAQKYRERVAVWAVTAAKAIGCREEVTEEIRQAALLYEVESPDGSAPPAIAAILHHVHEQWNGKGGPDGLSGAQIPLGARILAVTLAYADMVLGRPGSPMLYYLDAHAQLKRAAGAKFDPEVVKTFARVIGRT
jgi:HD-GYP domain-containing protein (c-di-GMP phosphodiesterase class II)